MSLETKMKRIETSYNKACEDALALIKELVKSHMTKHKELQKFGMGMGVWCYFTHEDYFVIDEDGEEWPQGDRQVDYSTSTHDVLLHLVDEQLVKVFDEWDEYLKLTGNPLQIVRDRVSGELVEYVDW